MVGLILLFLLTKKQNFVNKIWLFLEQKQNLLTGFCFFVNKIAEQNKLFCYLCFLLNKKTKFCYLFNKKKQNKQNFVNKFCFVP